MAITTERYGERREKLIELLSDAIECPEFSSETRKNSCSELPKEMRKDFARSIEKLKTDSFEIVLVGEFQGGKSTTFNTICDGREISPTGSGIKTSACRITARNIADPNEPERAVVTWKSDAELLLTCYDILARNLPKEERERFEEAKFNDFEGVSFDDPRDWQLMRDRVENEWEIYKKSPAAYDPQQEGKLDSLYIASLILEFRRDPTIVRERAETREIPLDAARTYVTFPNEWTIRWSDCEPKRFNVDEIKMAFVGKVDFYLHSPNLARLGCAIVDCPGLFAGPWDTQVATEAMVSADAILYLLNGDRQIGQQDLRALQEIRKTNQLHKLFFAVNARRPKEEAEKLRRVDAAIIGNNFKADETSDATFRIESDEIFVFNAFLSYNAKSRGLFEPGSAEAKARKKTTRRVLGAYLDLDPDDDAETLATLMENLEELLNASGYNALTNACESTVVARKARSLLLDSGATPAKNKLLEYEARLKLVEDNANKSVEEIRTDVAEARRAFEEFFQKTSDVVDEEFNDSASTLASALGENMFSEAFEQNLGLLAQETKNRVCDFMKSNSDVIKAFCDFILKRAKNYKDLALAQAKRALNGALSVLGFKVKNDEFARTPASLEERDDLTRKIESCVKEACNAVFKPALRGWFENIKQGRNDVYKATIGQKTRTIQTRRRLEWERMKEKTPASAFAYLQGGGIFDGADVAEVGSVPNEIGELERDIFIWLSGAALTQLIAQISTLMIGIFAWYAAVTVAAIILVEAVAWPIALVGALLTAIVSGKGLWEIGRMISDAVREWLGLRLLKELRETLNSSDVRAKIRQGAKDSGRRIVEECRAACRQNLEAKRRQLEKVLQDWENEMDADAAAREADAAEAKRVREEVAELRRPLEAFVEETSVYFEDATR